MIVTVQNQKQNFHNEICQLQTPHGLQQDPTYTSLVQGHTKCLSHGMTSIISIA